MKTSPLKWFANNRFSILPVLLLFSVGTFPVLAAAAGIVIVSGDEWTLSNQAFTQNSTNTTQLTTNIANIIGGTNYLIIENGISVNAYDTSFQTVLTNGGKTLTVNPASPFSSALLAQYDAIFLAGTVGSGAADASILDDYVRNGGSVYISLATSNFGSAAAEANAWNPFINLWGLTAGSVWFPNANVLDIPTVSSTHPLGNNISALTWGYGQAISELNPASPLTDIAVTGQFGGTFGDVGMVGVSSVPLPATLWLFGSGLLGLIGIFRRRRSS